jgi:hypothetical protein
VENALAEIVMRLGERSIAAAKREPSAAIPD